MRLIFAGSPDAAVPSLERLAAEHEIVAVLTREDAPRGRKRMLTPSVVAERAAALGLPVVKANRLTPDVVHELGALRPDLGVIVAYGALLRDPLLSAPTLGWINLHFSLLPRWRGAAPVQHALMAGDEVSGVSVFQLVEALDAGPLWARHPYRTGAHQTAGQLLDALAAEGAEVLTTVVGKLERHLELPMTEWRKPEPQEGEPTFAPKLALEDGRLRFARTASEVYNRFRAVTPEPGAFGILGEDRVKLLELEPARDSPPLAPGAVTLSVATGVVVGTATAPLRLVTVQPAGKRVMAATDWWRGLRNSEGMRFDG